MTKQALNEEIKELYVMNESLDESDVKKHHKKLYKQAIEVYGEWQKALRANAITKRKLKERQKFTLYAILKSRFLENGHEALRPKNIDQETKDKIVESYKTLKSLKDMIVNWTDEKVLFELRISLLSGANINTLDKDHPVLYEHLMDHFKDISHVIDEYDKRFGTPSIQPELSEQGNEEIEQVEQTSFADITANHNFEIEKLAETMVKMNYLQNTEDLYSIDAAQHVAKSDISKFIIKAFEIAEETEEQVSMKNIYKQNPIMYFAIKMHHGDLQTAINEMTKKFVVAG